MNIGLFFENIVEEAHNLTDENEKQIAYAYIAGYLTHYSLDVNTHPYIYYKSGFSQKEYNPFKVRYSLLHRKLETNIDQMIHNIVATDIPRKEKVWNLVDAEELQVQVIAKVLAGAINKAYDRNVLPKNIEKSLRFMTFIIKVLNNVTPSQKRIMEFGENITIGENVITSLIQDNNEKNNIDFLNLKKENWHMPWDKEEQQNTSFIELYNKAITEGVSLVTSLSDYAYNKISNRELMDMIQNKSLQTGVDSNLDIKFKYHDIIFKNV